MVQRSHILAVLMVSLMVLPVLFFAISPVSGSEGGNALTDDDDVIIDSEHRVFYKVDDVSVCFSGVTNDWSSTKLVVPDTVRDGAGEEYKVVRIGIYSIPRSITCLEIGANITFIEKPCFAAVLLDTAYITDIVVAQENETFMVDDNGCVVRKEVQNYLVMYPSGRTEPNATFDSTKYWVYDDYALDSAINIKTITNMSNDLVVLKKGAFFNCVNLEKFILENGKENILSQHMVLVDQYAFYNCQSLKQITFSENVTTIGDDAFTNCTSLESITIGENMKTINSEAFTDCNSLKNISVSSENIFFQVNDDGPYQGMLLRRAQFTTTFSYIALYPMNYDRTTLTISNDITGIDNYAFAGGNGKLEEVYYNINKSNLDASAFYNCASLKKVHLNNNVLVIGELAFGMCESLTEVTGIDKVVSINNDAFFLCTSLKTITLPETLLSIGNSAFLVSGIESITIPDSVEEIGSSAFYFTKLTDVTIEGHPSIGEQAFGGIDEITIIKHADFNVPSNAFDTDAHVTYVNMDEWQFPWYNVLGIIVCLIILAGMIYVFRKI